MTDDDFDRFWRDVVPYYGLDESFQYTDEQIAYHLNLYTTMAPWTRLKNDINGNSRWMIHWLDLEPVADRTLDLHTRHARVLNAARALGGKIYRSKDDAGGIVFQAYESQLPKLAERIRASLQEQTA